MLNNVFLEQIKRFDPKNIIEIKNAMKEVLQDIILVGLAKTDFFKYAAFYGGTSLRIFRALPRFSEDLDFTLVTKNTNIDFEYYLTRAKKELDSMMIDSELYTKDKKQNTTVQSYFYKFNLIKLFEISYPDYCNKITNGELLSIKVELETDVFEGGITERKLLMYPSFAVVTTFTMETLFASKLLAVLNRKWKTRVKGRDFYDYLFYISNKTKVNLSFLENGLKEFGYLEKNERLTLNRLKEELMLRFNSIDYDECKKDILPFISNRDSFKEAFNKDIFIATVDELEEA